MKGILLVAIIVALALISIWVSANSSQRHYKGKDGKFYVAWFVYLPGNNTCYFPEQTVELKDWVGTEYESLKGVSATTGEEIPEVTAALALKTIGLYTDYELKQRPDKSWILYRPAKTEKYFDMNAPYRITRGKLATDM